jgi:hypothetical protein
VTTLNKVANMRDRQRHQAEKLVRSGQFPRFAAQRHHINRRLAVLDRSEQLAR